MTAPDNKMVGRLDLKCHFQRLGWARMLVILVAVVLAVVAVEQPYRDRAHNYQENPAGAPYRWTEDGTMEYWQIVWDRIYLQWITIGIASAGAIALVSRKAKGWLTRPQQVVLGVATCAVLLTCVFPPVHYTDSSDMPKPGERRSYQTADGVWMSRDPILPRFLQGHRLILADYNGVLWRRLAAAWALIVVLGFVSAILLRGKRLQNAPFQNPRRAPPNHLGSP